MCTYYEAQKKKAQRRAPTLLEAALRALETAAARGIRPTEIAPVVRVAGEVENMSWGFRRQFARKSPPRRSNSPSPNNMSGPAEEKLSLHPLFGTCYAEAVEDDEPSPLPPPVASDPGKTAWKPVVNARDDKLDSPMWREAMAERRCLVPVTAFYEWSGPAGAKVTHRFDQNGEVFWVAGLWEDSPQFGRCYTMLTTEPNREVAAVHDRQLVVLLEEELEPWLNGAIFTSFRRPDGLLHVTSPVPNPLHARTPKPPPPAQGELF